jgi:WD40 repeat protein
VRPAAGAVTAVAFSPNGRLLAAGSYRRVALLDVSAGRTIRTLEGIESRVTSLAFPANGSVLAAASGTPGKVGQLAMWDVATGRRLRSLAAHYDLIYAIALRPDQRQLAAVSYDHLVSLWRLGSLTSTGQSAAPRFLRDHTDAVYGAAYSPDGRQLATAAGDRTIKMWDTETGKRLYTLSDSTAEQYTVAYRPGGKQLAAGGVDKTLRVWSVDAAGGTLIRSGFAHDGAILKVLYSHDGKWIFTSGEDDVVKQWDADSLEERAIYPKQPDWPQAIALSPDDSRLAVGRYDGTIALYDTATHQPVPGRLSARDVSARPPAPDLRAAQSQKVRPRRLAITPVRHALAAAAPRGPLPPGPAAAAHPARSAVHDFHSVHFVHRLASCLAEPPSAADPEITRKPGNESARGAQPIPVPSVVSGALWSGDAKAAAPAHYYRFAARKGQLLVLDVLARRAGSPLDSELEILDLQGRPVERAVLRAVGQTEVTLNDRDSISAGIRLLLRPDFGMKDYVLAGRELIQIYTLPKGPDDDYVFRSYRGQRTGFLGTTPEYHTVGAMVYKVEVHPPGSTFSPNGMPLTHLTYKNDDGGPLYGRDSYLEFTPPADGDYIVRLSDVRGQQGEKFTYKLRVHPPRPDFDIALSPAAIAVPKDGSAVLSVECERREGFDGEIAVRLEGLPTGFTATDAVIEAGESGASLQIAAAPGTPDPKADSPATYRVVATAAIDGKLVTRTVEPDSKGRRVSIGAARNVRIVTDVRDAVIRPGAQTVVEARITRLNGFKGRVPLDIRNLPYGVKVDDIGLNGVLITEQETSRKFVIRCEPWVKPQSRPFYVTASVEGGISDTAPPLTLHVTSSPTTVSHRCRLRRRRT